MPEAATRKVTTADSRSSGSASASLSDEARVPRSARPAAAWITPPGAAATSAERQVGIGAATTIFSVIQNVLLDPFPYNRRRGIGGKRIETKDLVDRADIDAFVGADAKSVRQIEPREQHLEALPFRGVRVEQQHAAFLWRPAAHIGDDEETRVRHLHQRARKDQAVALLATRPAQYPARMVMRSFGNGPHFWSLSA